MYSIYCLAKKPMMDVGLILGFTRGTTSKNLDDEITISSGILDSLKRKTTNLKAGVITYSNRAFIRQGLTSSDLTDVLQSINLRSGSNTLHAALQLANNNFFLTTNGGRNNSVKSLVIFVTESADINTIKMVQVLREQGVNIAIIGVGENVDQSEVDKFAGTGKTGIIMNGDKRNIVEKVYENLFTGNIQLN